MGCMIKITSTNPNCIVDTDNRKYFKGEYYSLCVIRSKKIPLEIQQIIDKKPLNNKMKSSLKHMLFVFGELNKSCAHYMQVIYNGKILLGKRFGNI